MTSLRWSVPALLIAGLVPALAQAEFRPCRGMAVARPASPTDSPTLAGETVPANAVGCVRGLPLRLDGGTVLWRCQAIAPGDQDLPEGMPDHAFLLERPGRPLALFPDMLMAGRFAAFELISVDLDGDGTAERVLAAWNAQGNGLGVNSWTIRVFDAGWTLRRQFDAVSDWGDGGVVAAPGGRKGCDIAITDFAESRNRRGVEGISLRARFYRWTGAAVEQAVDRPTLLRRYDRAFERRRTAHFRRAEERGGNDVRGNVRDWLSSRSTQPAPPGTEMF